MTTQQVQGLTHRVTIDDIANVAGVSRQTVSNVVRNQGRVGDATRERVQHTIDELGYRPHQGARSLRTMRTSQIALVIPDSPRHLDANGSAELLPHLASALERRGQRLLVALDRVDRDDVLTLAGSGTVDGLIVSATPGDLYPRTLAGMGMPFVCLGQIDHQLPQSWVDINDSDGVESVVRYLVERGHRRIAYVGYDFVSSTLRTPAAGRRFALREHGFRSAMARADLPLPEAYIRREPSEGVSSTFSTLFLGPERPTAVVAASDLFAADVYTSAHACGLSVGATADLAVTGFGGAGGGLLNPTLTTVAVPYARLADMLVERVMQEISGEGGCPGQMLDLLLQCGESA